MKTIDMLNAHPRRSTLDLTVVSECINACVECAEICTSCADACLAEEKVQSLTKCIRINLDCADVCQTTARLLARQTESVTQLLRAQVESCIVACQLCAKECEVHSEMHQHCRICRAACQNCEKICQELLVRFSEGGITERTRSSFL